jgi:anti-sigma regulatory factor (Ser/Thr protein kinase)
LVVGGIGQTMAIGLDLELSLAPTVAAPARARAAMVAWRAAEHASPGLVESADLMISELVTNSVRHAALVAHQPLLVYGRLRSETLWLEVTDAGTSGSVEQRSGRAGSGGLGLELVGRLSRDWGVDRDADGTTVWFELATATDGRGDRR